MADGLNPALEGAINSQTSSINSAIAGLNQTGLGASGAIAKGIEGLHQIKDEILKTEVTQLPDIITKIYDLLSQTTAGIKSLQELNEEIQSANDESLTSDAKKVGQQKFEASDLSKFPAHIAAGPLFLGAQLQQIFGKDSIISAQLEELVKGSATSIGKFQEFLGESSPLWFQLDHLKDAISIIVDNLETATVKKESKGPAQGPAAKGPKLDFEDEGWKKLAETISLFAATAVGMNIAQIQLGIFSLHRMAEFIEVAKSIFLSVQQLPDGQVEKFKIFIESINIAFSAIIKASLLGVVLIALSKIAIMGLRMSEKFIDEAIKLINYKDCDWKELAKTAKEFSTFTKEFASAMSSLVAAAWSASILSMIALMAIMGVFLAIGFLYLTILLIKVAEKIQVEQVVKVTLVANELKKLFSSMVVALGFAALILIFIIPAIFGLLGVIIFLLLVALVGLIAGALKVPLALFTTTTLMIAKTMLLFALTLFVIGLTITTNLIKKTLQIVVGIAILLVAFAILGILGYIVSIAIAGITAAAILLLVAVLALFVVFKLLEKFPDMSDVNEKLGIICEFFLMLMSHIFVFLIGMIAALFLAVASILLLIGLVFLFLAVIFLEFVAKSILRLMSMEFKGMPKGLIGAFGIIALFFLGLIALTPILLYALPAVLLLAISSILLFISFLLLTITIALALAIVEMMKGPGILLLPLKLTAFFLALLPLGLASLGVILIAVPLLIAAVLLLVIFVALTLTIALALAIHKMPLGKEDYNNIRDNILALFGIVSLKLAAAALKVMIVGAPILIASVMMLTIFASIAGAYAAIKKLKEYQDDAPDPSGVFQAVSLLASIIKDASEKTEGASIFALAKFKIGIGAITEAIALIVDTIIKLAKFSRDNPEGQALLESAQESLGEILNKFFGVGPNPSDFSILKVFESMPEISKSQLRATQALVPLTEAIDQITDTILKVVNIENIDLGISNIKMIASFITDLQNFANGFSSGFFGLGDSSSKVKAATKSTGEMIPLIDNLATIANKASEFENIKLNIEECIVAPLLQLEKPISKLTEVRRAVGELNSELSKLTKDNKDTLKSLGQIGNSTPSAISSVLGKISGFFKKGDSQESSSMGENKEDPLETIAKDVRGIAEKLIKNNTSWTDK